MLKKFLVLFLSISTAVSMIGCGCGTTKEENIQAETIPTEDSADVGVPAQPMEEEMTTDTTSTENQGEGESIGQSLLQEFHRIKQEKPEITAQEMADSVLALDFIQFEGATMPVEQGFLTGFNNAEITGFKEGVMFAPMIGSIPFVGYVFTLEDGTNAASFVDMLRENADPRWNICTEAEETVVESAEDMVFFVMCPTQFE